MVQLQLLVLYLIKKYFFKYFFLFVCFNTIRPNDNGVIHVWEVGCATDGFAGGVPAPTGLPMRLTCPLPSPCIPLGKGVLLQLVVPVLLELCLLLIPLLL